MKDEDFKKTLSLGKMYEQKFLTHMKCKVETSNSKEYDMIIDNKKYEVKADRWTEKTGNIVIEYESNGKLSGISTTEADFYAYYSIGKKDILYIIPVPVIREYIQDKKYKCILNAGYKKLSYMYLFNKDIFLEYIHGDD